MWVVGGSSLWRTLSCEDFCNSAQSQEDFDQPWGCSQPSCQTVTELAGAHRKEPQSAAITVQICWPWVLFYMAKWCIQVLKTHPAGTICTTYAENVPNVFMSLMFHFRSLRHNFRTTNSTCSLLCSRKPTLVCSSQLANRITWLWRSLFHTWTPDNVRKLVPSSVPSERSG